MLGRLACHFPATKGCSYRLIRNFVRLVLNRERDQDGLYGAGALGEASLVTRMSKMREWLDSHRYEPDLFQYRKEPRGALLRVDFKIEKEAFEFADAFGGSLVR